MAKKPKSYRRKGTLSARRKKGGRRRSRKGLLSEMFTPATAMQSGKTVLSGMVGGAGSRLISKLIPEENTLTQGLVQLGASFIVSSVLKMPNVGAGMAGAYGAKLMDKLTGTMSEEGEYTEANGLDRYPDALDENGTPMFLAEDGNFYYLEEFELSESFQDETMYPRYVNASSF